MGLLQQLQGRLHRIVPRWPVQKKDVGDVDPQVAQALFHRRHEPLRNHIVGKNFGRDEELIARNVEARQDSPQLRLVAVPLCGIERAIPDLDRVADGLSQHVAL